MKRIFISTNYDQLFNVIGDRNDTEGIYQIGNDFFSILENGDIVLLQDNLESLPSEMTINSTNDYLLYHTGTSSDNIKCLFSSKISGRHENTVGSNYKEVFDILLDFDANKTERILEYLFPEALDNSLKQLHDIADGKEEFEVQGEKVVFNGSPTHIFALAAKRDELLENKDNAN